MSRPTRGPSEAEFAAQVIALARLRGWLVAHFRPARTAAGWRTAVQGDGAGFPDLVLTRRPPRPGRLVVAELKAGRNAATGGQAEWLAAFRAAGAEAHVWRPGDWDRIDALLTSDP